MIRVTSVRLFSSCTTLKRFSFAILSAYAVSNSVPSPLQFCRHVLTGLGGPTSTRFDLVFLLARMKAPCSGHMRAISTTLSVSPFASGPDSWPAPCGETLDGANIETLG